jgi:hypothetical protein
MIGEAIRKLSYVWAMKPIKQHSLVGRSVAITEESDLRSKPLRYRDICTKYHEEWLGHSGNNEVISSAS